MTETIDETEKPAGIGPVIILVEPQLGENIGMVARAWPISASRNCASWRRATAGEREGGCSRQQRDLGD